MIKYIYCLLILFIIFSCKKTNTAPQSSPPPVTPDTLNAWIKYPRVDTLNNSGFGDIWFTDSVQGIAAGSQILYSSEDGGKTWDGIVNTVGADNIQFLDALNGFAYGRVLSATSDGGKTWTIKTGRSGFFIQFLSTTAGFSYVLDTGIYNTHNGGNSWTPRFQPAISPNERCPFYFLDSLKGFSMINGNCYKTVDGGVNWQELANVTNLDFSSFYKMQFLDTLNGYCGAPEGLLKTTDGGRTWNVSLGESFPFTSFIVPQFFDTNNGYCMTNHSIFKTTDGGQHWTLSCSLGTSYLTGIHFLDMNTGWACTSDGYVLRLKS